MGDLPIKDLAAPECLPHALYKLTLRKREKERWKRGWRKATNPRVHLFKTGCISRISLSKGEADICMNVDAMLSISLWCNIQIPPSYW